MGYTRFGRSNKDSFGWLLCEEAPTRRSAGKLKLLPSVVVAHLPPRGLRPKREGVGAYTVGNMCHHVLEGFYSEPNGDPRRDDWANAARPLRAGAGPRTSPLPSTCTGHAVRPRTRHETQIKGTVVAPGRRRGQRGAEILSRVIAWFCSARSATSVPTSSPSSTSTRCCAPPANASSSTTSPSRT